jgi:membrane fusion protein YbhG
MKIKKIILGVLVLIIITVIVIKINLNSNFYYAGTVEATEVDVPSRLSSTIRVFLAKEGVKVKKSDTLVKLSCEDIEIEAENAREEFKRAVKLKNNASINQESFKRFKFRNDKAALRLSWCEIKSPINGTVLDTYYESSEMVSPGAKLLTLADLREVWAYIYVPGPMLAKLSFNMDISAIIPELPGKQIKGRISKINDEAEFTPKNAQTRQERTRLVYGIKITFKNNENILKPGMSIEVKLPD